MESVLTCEKLTQEELFIIFSALQKECPERAEEILKKIKFLAI
jgi:hypothetical protein